MRRVLPLLIIFLLLFPTAADAYGKRPIGRTRAMSRGSTTGAYIERLVWLPGQWKVEEGSEKLTFTRIYSDGKHESFVRIQTIPREECAYGVIRMRALKVWGGKNLEQNQGRIQPISFGTSKYKGYTWMEPSSWSSNHHWCVAQDLKSAFHIVASEGDNELRNFMQDVLLQLVVRSGRSTLPWPTASEHASSSSSQANFSTIR